MTKKLILAMLIVLLPVFCLAQEPVEPPVEEPEQEDWAIFAQGGVFSTYNNLTDGHLWGTANFMFSRQIYDKLHLRGSYQDMQNDERDANDYSLQTVFYTRNSMEKFQLYLLLGGGFLHDSKATEFAVASWSGGVGLMIPIPGGEFAIVVELTGKGMEGDTYTKMTSGFRVPIKM